MRTRIAHTRIVTTVTLIAMFAFGATSAFGSGMCMQRDHAAVQQQPHHHGAPAHGTDSSAPCQHASTGGVCASATLPAATAAFSVTSPTIYVARVIEAAPLHRLLAAAVFHPPRF
jgi:hypothetical protein